jgi:hypothetical protein
MMKCQEMENTGVISWYTDEADFWEIIVSTLVALL